MSLVPVIVTGGAGFIGTHLVHSLLDNRQRVLTIDRVAKPKSLTPSNLLIYKRMNVANVRSMSMAGIREAKIVHLAAEVSVVKSVQDPISTIRSNIGVTCEMLEFARKIDSDRFVLASTAAVYGDKAGRCRETDPPSPASPYAVSKLACEHYCRIYSSLYGIQTVILRYFNVYGPGQSSQYAGAISSFIKRAFNGKPPVIFGDGKQTRDFVYKDDVVAATIASLERKLSGGTTLNIATSRPITINSLASKIMKICERSYLKATHRPPRRGDIRHSVADISEAQLKIGFRPLHDLDRGLRETIDWFRKAN